jgi:hypothetical protein
VGSSGQQGLVLAEPSSEAKPSSSVITARAPEAKRVCPKFAPVAMDSAHAPQRDHQACTADEARATPVTLTSSTACAQVQECEG